MTAKILIVEDVESITLVLRYNFEAEGYQVTVIERGDQAELAVAEEKPDLIILDWMLPGLSGIELCRRWRAGRATRHIPIIILTARGEEADRIRGLALGADDYVVKPFSVPELMARVTAILRRSNPAKIADVLSVDDILVDREAHEAIRAGRKLRLGPTEFKLLTFFMESPGRVFSRAQLLDGVWGHDAYVDERTVDVHVGRLRKSINRGRERDPIRTVRGAGYAFGERPSRHASVGQ